MVSSISKPSLCPGPSVLKRFFSALWWQHVLTFSWQFRRYLYLPALLFTVFSFALTPTLDMLGGLKASTTGADGITEAGPLIKGLVLGIVGLSTSGIFFICGMVTGVFRLTAFTRAYLFCPLPQDKKEMVSPPYKQEIIACQAEAMGAMSKQSAYLAQAYLLAILFMIPSLFVIAIAGTCALLWTSPAIAAGSLPISPDQQKLAPLAAFIAAAMSVMLNNYSMVTVAVTSMTNRTVWEATKQSMLLAITTAPLMTAASAVALALISLITTPYQIYGFLHNASALTTPGSLPIALSWEAWQSLSGIIVYPVTTAFLTEVVRDLIVTNDRPEPPVEHAVSE